MDKETVVRNFAEKQKERDVLRARQGGFFRRTLDALQLAPWKETEYEALDALEERINALEAHTNL